MNDDILAELDMRQKFFAEIERLSGAAGQRDLASLVPPTKNTAGKPLIPKPACVVYEKTLAKIEPYNYLVKNAAAIAPGPT